MKIILSKLNRFFLNNKQLVVGLVFSILLILPASILYINDLHTNKQVVNQPDTIQKPTDNINLQSLTPSTEQSSTENRGSSQTIEGHTSNPSNTNSQNNTSPQPYEPSVCTEKPIPYETKYKEASELYPSQSYTGLDGRNGSIKTCTADSFGFKPIDLTDSPSTRSVWVGTRTNTPVQPNSELASQRARVECIPVANMYGYDSVGDNLCIQSITRKLLGN
jgi:hypothetical protein